MSISRSFEIFGELKISNLQKKKLMTHFDEFELLSLRLSILYEEVNIRSKCFLIHAYLIKVKKTYTNWICIKFLK